MIVTAGALDALRTGFRNDYNIGFKGYQPMWGQVATRVPSSTESNTYGWLREFPRMREWIGDRNVKSISEGSYKIENKDFEATVSVKKTKIEDDTFGIYSPMMQGLGQSAAEFPDELVFSMIADGFTSECWDGQNFFDTEHPVGNDAGDTYSNFVDGGGPAWFLLDTSRPLKPFIFQERQAPQFVAMTAPDSPEVFKRKEYQYGVDARWNAGYAFPQTCFASRAPLNGDNYSALRKMMESQTGETGKKLNIKPNLFVGGPSLRATAKQLFQAALIVGGGDNIFYKDVDVLIVPWLE